ncbi:hypothetical protein Tco_1328614 [Tanacetum coccineum]
MEPLDNVRMDLTRSSPLTQTGMVDFVPGHVVIDATHRKRVKYEAKCANIRYGFLPFSFSSLGELEKDADGGLNLCVDLTGSSPLTQIGMADSVPSRAVIDVAQRKRVKYMAKCAAIGYGFLPFSFSSLGELEVEAVLCYIRFVKYSDLKFYRAQTLGNNPCCVHIFIMISFAYCLMIEG